MRAILQADVGFDDICALLGENPSLPADEEVEEENEMSPTRGGWRSMSDQILFIHLPVFWIHLNFPTPTLRLITLHRGEILYRIHQKILMVWGLTVIPYVERKKGSLSFLSRAYPLCRWLVFRQVSCVEIGDRWIRDFISARLGFKHEWPLYWSLSLSRDVRSLGAFSWHNVRVPNFFSRSNEILSGSVDAGNIYIHIYWSCIFSWSCLMPVVW